MRSSRTNEINIRLDMAIKRITQGCWDGVREGAEIVREEALRLCPKDTGRLRESCPKPVIDRRGPTIFGTIEFRAPYAIYVHECNRAYRTPGTQWKYLETALHKMARPAVRQAIIGRINWARAALAWSEYAE